jgi:hypothetical protein
MKNKIKNNKKVAIKNTQKGGIVGWLKIKKTYKNKNKKAPYYEYTAYNDSDILNKKNKNKINLFNTNGILFLLDWNLIFKKALLLK